ncbi:MAG: PAS domain S-box protein [Candidatus Omnitrophica bacterium]|nr:PAS domain S-box protein [Candidatus Omnitrophota bacterium]
MKHRSKLEQENRQYSELFKHNPNGIAVYEAVDGGKDFIFKDFNPAAERMSKKKREEVLGKSVLEMFPAVASSRFGLFSAFQEVYRTGRMKTHPAAFYQDDQLTAWYENMIYRLPSGEVVAIYEDITERKKIENLLKDSESTLKGIISAAPIGVGVVVYRVFKSVNQRLCEMLGYSESELLNQNARIVCPSEEEYERGGKIKYQRIDEMGVGAVETKWKRKDGSIMDVHLSSAAINAEELSAGVIFTVLDITERKRAEETILKAQQELEEQVRNRTEELVQVNEALREGISERKRVEEKLKTLTESLEQKIEERTKQFQEQAQELAHTNEELRKEIEERKHAEEELRDSEERSKILFENGPDAYYLTDLAGTFVDGNRKAEELTGFRREELIGKNFLKLQLIPLTEIPKAASLLAKSVRGLPTGPVEMTLNRRDGTRIILEISTYPIRIKGKTLIFGAARDVTARRQLETQLVHAQKMEATGRLAGGIAHDFNNQLMVITGYCDFLLTELDQHDSRYGEVMEIRKASERASALTKQLLAFGRRQIVIPKVFNINALILDLKGMMKQLAGEGIDLILGLSDELKPVKADPAQMEQVFVNLAVNARDAMPGGGKMTVETKNVMLEGVYLRGVSDLPPGNYVMVAFSDTGIGMTEEVKTRIFEPFFTTKEKSKGTGLGLATSYGIIKQNRGDIQVYSEPGYGTTFKIYLPISDEQPERLISEKKPEDVPKGSEGILVIEDEETVRKLAVAVLEKQGYRVVATDDCEKMILEMQMGRLPDIKLLITDFVMPEMDGRELADRLLEINPRMKVLFISGYADHAVLQQGIPQVPHGFLQKPFTAAALSFKVREILDSPNE